ncbi:MAG TPA: hypothetical protein VLK65_18835 [Vicinamibacteria bacterium]|nr:hypothetical protein [Vicinamibacteria bacterium]
MHLQTGIVVVQPRRLLAIGTIRREGRRDLGRLPREEVGSGFLFLSKRETTVH